MGAWVNMVKNKAGINGSLLSKMAMMLDEKNVGVPDRIEFNEKNKELLAHFKTKEGSEEYFTVMAASTLTEAFSILDPNEKDISKVVEAVNALHLKEASFETDLNNVKGTIAAGDARYEAHLNGEHQHITNVLKARANRIQYSPLTGALSIYSDNTLLDTVTIVPGGGGSVIPVTDLIVSPITAQVQVGGITSIHAEVRPTNASNKVVVWESSDASVASVDNNGNVTGHKMGTCTITAESVDGGFKDKCTVTVAAAVIPVSNVILNFPSKIADEGSSFALVATVSPANATDQSVTWATNNPAVATVDNMGTVNCISSGTATITCRATSNPLKFASCTITVQVAPDAWHTLQPSCFWTAEARPITLTEGILYADRELCVTTNPTNKDKSQYLISDGIAGVDFVTTRHMYWLIFFGNKATEEYVVLGLGNTFTGQIASYAVNTGALSVHRTPAQMGTLNPELRAFNFAIGDRIRMEATSATAYTIKKQTAANIGTEIWEPEVTINMGNLSSFVPWMTDGKHVPLSGLWLGVSGVETQNLSSLEKKSIFKDARAKETM